MKLTNILAISGKPGLYKLLGRTRGGVIVESIAEKKRMPISATNSISALEEIAMYTDTDELPIREIMRRIAEKENNGAAPSAKADPKELREYFAQIVPDFDRDRVYDAHIKKLIQWYNILQAADMVSKEHEDEEQTETAE
ncbi:MAG: DUF5606 domain-containing protein [Flavobacteriales bacterium]|nr:DUF5606 domain-containing protein [Flavobacteriales bacterium]